jgi:nitroreductase/NAD-dependent dihydropyrimidine dehydrogenase PreA subunit
MKKLDFVVDSAKCVRCNGCVADCPCGVIVETASVPEIPADRADDCIGCQHCLAVCPTGAISIFGLDPADSIELHPALLPTRDAMDTLLRGRRSIRQYRRDPVPRQMIRELLAAVAHAPTGCNDRGLIFSVIETRTGMTNLLDAIAAAADAAEASGRTLPEFLPAALAARRRDGTDEILRGAPHLLLASARPGVTCPGEDTVIALAYFELLAQSAGLGTTWCGYLKFIVDALPELRTLLKLDPDQYFYAMLFGRPAVRYVRTVQRDRAAEIRTLEL